MGDVAPGTGVEIVDAQHFVAGLDQPVAQMRAEEPRPTGDEHALMAVITP